MEQVFETSLPVVTGKEVTWQQLPCCAEGKMTVCASASLDICLTEVIQVGCKHGPPIFLYPSRINIILCLIKYLYSKSD